MAGVEEELGLEDILDGMWDDALRQILVSSHAVLSILGRNRAPTILPPRSETFRAINYLPPSDWRVVIFGQNPYNRPSSASGTAFCDAAVSSWGQKGVPPSMRNMLKSALVSKNILPPSARIKDIRAALPTLDLLPPPQWFIHTILSGVCWLNTSLTVDSADGSSHAAFWKPVIRAILVAMLSARVGNPISGGKTPTGPNGLVVVLWGSKAQKQLYPLISKLTLQFDVPVRFVQAHVPSVETFFATDSFGEINAALSDLGYPPIDWLPTTQNLALSVVPGLQGAATAATTAAATAAATTATTATTTTTAVASPAATTTATATADSTATTLPRDSSGIALEKIASDPVLGKHIDSFRSHASSSSTTSSTTTAAATSPPSSPTKPGRPTKAVSLPTTKVDLLAKFAFKKRDTPSPPPPHAPAGPSQPNPSLVGAKRRRGAGARIPQHVPVPRGVVDDTVLVPDVERTVKSMDVTVRTDDTVMASVPRGRDEGEGGPRKIRKTAHVGQGLLAGSVDISRYLVDPTRLIRGSAIGEGGFGSVRAARLNGAKVAVKTLHGDMDEKTRAAFETEVGLLMRMEHPNIVRLLGVCLRGIRPCIVLEFMPYSLSKLVHEARMGTAAPEVGASQGFLPLRMALVLLRDVARAIRYLHAQDPPIIHRDLKPANILVDATLSRAVVCDFGVSRRAQDSSHTMTKVGTPVYMAVEVLGNKTYTAKVDIYSFAMVMYTVFTGYAPFSAPGNEFGPFQVLFQIATHNARPSLDLPIIPSLPGLFLDLMCAAWDANPSARPEIDVLIEAFSNDHRVSDGSEPTSGSMLM